MQLPPIGWLMGLTALVVGLANAQNTLVDAGKRLSGHKTLETIAAAQTLFALAEAVIWVSWPLLAITGGLGIYGILMLFLRVKPDDELKVNLTEAASAVAALQRSADQSSEELSKHKVELARIQELIALSQPQVDSVRQALAGRRRRDVLVGVAGLILSALALIYAIVQDVF